MKRLNLALIITIFILVGFWTVNFLGKDSVKKVVNTITEEINQDDDKGESKEEKPHPLSIEALKKGEYPGSDIVIEQTLGSGSNYQRYIASYKSEGLKIYALLTVPNGSPPEAGWPVIIFNHGYIPPSEYQTTERYIAYTDVFSRNGYVLLKPDYRGHGNSEGQATGGYGSNAYTIDVLNAVASLKRLNSLSFWQAERDQNLPEDPGQARMTSIVNPEKIGMWGHSMGGHITLKNMVVSKDVKAGVIWAGVTGSYPDLVERWRRSPTPTTLPGNVIPSRGGWRQGLIEQYGEPKDNPEFWNSLSANSYLSDISGPVQLHHGTADTSVPLEFSEKLEQQMKQAGKEVELYEYLGDDHNLSASLYTALQRSVEFFDKYLK